MGFLSPWLLLLGVAAAIPVLLHLMHRRPGPRLDFPALRYLRRAQKESGRRVRLRQLLLLALRVAAVLLLALAAARPFLRTGASGHPPTDVVIVLDNSLSTQLVDDDGRVFDALRDAAQTTLDAAGADDRFWLVRAAEPDAPALFGDRARVATALAEVEPVDARADLHAAVRRARALLAAARTGRPGEVHVLTDLQASAFDATNAKASPPDAANGPNDEHPVFVFAPQRQTVIANRGVGDVTIAGGLAPRAGVASTASAEVVGSGSDSVTLRLWIGDRPASAALAAPGAAAVFNLPARPAGVVVGRVEAEPDALRADDRRWFAYVVTPPVDVAARVDAPFVREALAALASANRIRLAADARVAVAEAATIGAAPTNASAFVLIAPDSAQYLPAANTALARLGTGLRLEPDAARGSAQVVATAATPELRDARVTRAYRIDVAPGARADTLLRLSDGRPWLVRARTSSDQAVLLLASPLVPDASTIPASAAMIPLLDRMTGEWSGVAEAGTGALEPGTSVQLPPRTAAILDPADSILPAEGGAPWTLPVRAGVYRALASADARGEVLAAWAVAAPAAESRLERLSDDDVESALGGDVDVVSDPASWTDAIFAQRTGAEWWRALLLVAIIALLIESILAATKPASSSQAPASSGPRG
ncbi:MAG TPA: BatA and WFA domain-containing protein [Longimicrobiales bacterium]